MLFRRFCGQFDVSYRKVKIKEFNILTLYLIDNPSNVSAQEMASSDLFLIEKAIFLIFTKYR